MDIIAASSNPHKISEFYAILAPLGFMVASIADVHHSLPEVEENGTTYADNAIIKAQTYAEVIGKPVFSDDSGIEVKALGGEPGVYSARYGGIHASDPERLDKLLDSLAPYPDRSARFVCVIAVATPERLIGIAVGEVRGNVAAGPRGKNGFGYDPIFIPEGYTQTLAELDTIKKHALSHRGRALRKAVELGLFSHLS
jgi:XTP/dITP diphosphohydrolase